jgi:RNA polymerase sigma-70 factor (ECF subfamily)
VRRDTFVTTHWSVVLAAGANLSSPGASEALATLCEAYWYPLYAYLRGRGHNADAAQDLTQAFFSRLLEKRVLSRADPARGRFRSFLLASLKNFAANEHERDTAGKRGSGVPVLSLEFETAEGRFQLEPPSNDTPETIFDRQWAHALLERAVTRLRVEAEGDRKAAEFVALKGYLTGDAPHVTYAKAGATLGMSEGAVKVAVHRLRRRFRDVVRGEIAQTVSSAEEIEEEIRHLWSAVGRP